LYSIIKKTALHMSVLKMLIKSDQELWRIQIQGVWWKVGVVVVYGWDLGRLKCNPFIVWIQNWFDLKSFLKWNVFQLSEKKLVVLSNQPVVLFLEGFEKGWKLFDLVDLTVKQNQSVVSCFQPIVSLKILTEFNFDLWNSLKWFLTECALVLNVFNYSLEYKKLVIRSWNVRKHFLRNHSANWISSFQDSHQALDFQMCGIGLGCTSNL